MSEWKKKNKKCVSNQHQELQKELYNSYKQPKQHPLIFRFYGIDKKFQRIGQNRWQKKERQETVFFQEYAQ